MTLIGLSPLIVSLAGLLASFDLVVRKQHDDYLDSWRSDGEPHGFFWIPRESRNRLGLPRLSSTGARNKCAWRWLFMTADWARADVGIHRMLIAYRVFMLLWILAIASLTLTG